MSVLYSVYHLPVTRYHNDGYILVDAWTYRGNQNVHMQDSPDLDMERRLKPKADENFYVNYSAYRGIEV